MDWTKVFEALITLIIIVITSVLIPYLKAKIGTENYKQLVTIVKVAVQAAEQIFNETGMGTKKKEYVLDFLHNMGLNINESELDNLIESAVLELKRGI